ncbi:MULTISPECIES: hypothetical protein [unclassified Methanosarcina]|jgi:hypothetical protein|uniref:hypothetical protein n=1 Tax=unclassified Methanosarcina TaxID=2644672 RepID=UPI000A70AAF6|nr:MULTISPECIES: hypothetical protein [unclassified Methanosarcina]
MAKLQQNNNTGAFWFIIPKSSLKAKGWVKGDEFFISDEPNGIKFMRREARV